MVVASRRQERQRRFTSAFLILTSVLNCLCLKLGSQALAHPSWWQHGQPRQRFQSLAEAELLSQIAVLLMPHEDVGESFRRYPVERSSSWGSSYLEPGCSAYGVLQDDAAALFVEYNGYDLRTGVRGVHSVQRKDRALLEFAPAGSCIVRIGHSQVPMEQDVYHMCIKKWHDQQSLLLGLRTIVQRMMHDLTNVLCDDVAAGMQQFLNADRLSEKALAWVQCISVRQRATFRLDQVTKWLTEIGLTSAEAARVLARFPQVLGYSIEGNLRPTVLWLEELGLTRAQVARVLARFPKVLSCSIEGNLRPTVLWLGALGLTRAQVARVLARWPQVLGCSIEGNLRPTVLWLEELGLTRAQVALVLARWPQVLSLSIEGNLRPTVLWLGELGLTRAQVALVAARCPQLLGCSIEGNLRPKVLWLGGLGLAEAQVAHVVARHPQILSYSIKKNLKPKVELLRMRFTSDQLVESIVRHPPLLAYNRERLITRIAVLSANNMLSPNRLASCMRYTPERFAKRFLAS